MFELFVDGKKIGDFETLNECYQKFDSIKVRDWLILEDGHVVDKKDKQ